MGMRFHSHACIFTYTCSWNISTYCMQTHEKSIFLMHARCSSPIPPSKNGFYEFWVYMVKGDHNTSYYYFCLTQMPKYHKVSFLSSVCSILYQNSFPLMETTPISLWVHLHVPLFTELGKFDGVLLTWGRVYKPMQCICVRACVCGPGGFCHLVERFLQNSHILTWRMLIRGRPSDELGCDGKVQEC